MSRPTLMHLRIFLPFAIFANENDVSDIVADGPDGSFGLLPRRLDCVSALAPGILSYTKDSGNRVYVAIDQGVLIKTGSDVAVSVRNAIRGTDLRQLRDTVEKEFRKDEDQNWKLHHAMDKMESGLIARIAEFHRE